MLINRTSVPKTSHDNKKAAANSVPIKEQIISAQQMAKEMVKSFVDDRVYLYACVLLTLGLIRKVFYYAVRACDGESYGVLETFSANY